MKKHTFTAAIINAGRGGAFVEVPFDVENAFGAKKPKVKATFDGVPYRGILARMGNEAKKEETRQNRIVKMIEMLKKGKKGV